MKTVFAALCWLGLASSAAADGTLLGLDPDSPSKKERFLADKAATPPSRHVSFDKAVGKPPVPVINIFNHWTQETIAVDAQRLPGLCDVSVPQATRFLRCHFTNEQAPDFDPRLFALLVNAARHFHSARVEIVSGYRAPKYNLMLRKKGHNVARESQHAVGHAVDFRLAGVPIKTLMQWVKKAHLGGVGFYATSHFVHADTGPVRFWKGD